MKLKELKEQRRRSIKSISPIKQKTKMNLAQPAPAVEAAIAAPAEATNSVNEDDEYKVKPAPNVSDRFNVDRYIVEPAVTIDNPREFAPNKHLNEPFRYGV